MPWIIGFLLFTAGPMLFSLYTSFTKYNIIAAPKWIGLENYQRMFTATRCSIRRWQHLLDGDGQGTPM